MQITKDTRVSDILLEYGDIAEVMEVFGVKRVGRYSLQRGSRWNGRRASIASRWMNFSKFCIGQSQEKRKNPDMTQPKEHPEKLRRRVIALFFSGLLLMAVFAVWLGWACADWGRFNPGWLNQTFGPALIVGGVALVVWSVCVQYDIGKGTPAPKVATLELVTQGPYAYSRNPMTLGALLLYLGIGVWMGSSVVVILTVIVFSGLLTFIYLHETRELAERFGDAYQEYRKRTPFLLPRCRHPR